MFATISQGKDRRLSGNFDSCIGYEPCPCKCYINYQSTFASIQALTCLYNLSNDHIFSRCKVLLGIQFFLSLEIEKAMFLSFMCLELIWCNPVFSHKGGAFENGLHHLFILVVMKRPLRIESK